AGTIADRPALGSQGPRAPAARRGGGMSASQQGERVKAPMGSVLRWAAAAAPLVPAAWIDR
ncbi:MAG: hypothetical protein M3P51_18375, partial [Chloroflexota bacterium]|nr:hypothetical protein [Chloroflexota bacterium]